MGSVKGTVWFTSLFTTYVSLSATLCQLLLYPQRICCSKQDVQSLTQAIEEMGNPLAEQSSDILVLNSRDVVDTAVADTMWQMEKLGLEQYETYVVERLVNQTVPITDPIQRNNLHPISHPPVREKSWKQIQMSSLKNDYCLFYRLYIAFQIQHVDLDDFFFQHENQACPPSRPRCFA